MSAATLHDQRNQRIAELGRKYWRRIQGRTPGFFDRQYRQGQLIDWVMQDESFKIDAFRFIDVLPTLHTTEAFKSHVRDYLLKDDRKLPAAVSAVLRMTGGSLTAPFASSLVRTSVRDLARRFICGEDSMKAVKVLRELNREKLTFTADILGEATLSDTEAEQYLQHYLDLVALLGESVEKWPDDQQLYASSAGPLPRANISVKISALDPNLDAADHSGSVARLKERLLPLMRLAREKNVFINFDLEQWALHNITYALFEEVAMHKDLVDWPHIGIVLQAYLKESSHDCERLLSLSRKRGTPFTVRLVKGAYWDYEVVRARVNGLPCPVFKGKGLTDANYENLSVTLIENNQFLSPAFASHNLRSLVHAIVVAEEKGVEKDAFEVQMLYGMAEPQRRIFADDGFRVRIYCPIGELLPGMAYLVRRLLENTSNIGFLRQSYHDGVSIDTMLEPPVLTHDDGEATQRLQAEKLTSFTNVGQLDFCQDTVRNSFDKALEDIGRNLPFTIPLVLNGRQCLTDNKFTRESPDDQSVIVAEVSRADVPHAEEAIQAAKKAFPVWRDTPLQRRVKLLEELAGRLERERYELVALQAYEVGKPRREADADVAEAIDFCRYYAHRAGRELAPERQGNLPGEDNILWYEGRGPTLIISPWNFPLAILCGMTTAALVAGNPVLIKPASPASTVAYHFFQNLLATGFPAEIVHFLPGAGGEIGQYLVRHPDIVQIAFTGSKEVGLDIIEQAGKTVDGQLEVKKVVCEMGGKNAIIVDEDADPDAALQGILQSAFGYAGQKCSACSRLILVGDIYESFIKRLVEACKSLPLAEATDPGCRMGPVIDKKARDRLKAVIENPPAGAEVIFQGDVPEKGYFVPPVLFRVMDSANPLMQEELFGPVLAVIRVKSFKEALAVAGGTEFALTGGVYSRSPSNLALARRKFKVGNLYINRSCTGSIVGRQPFGGFGMSGIGTKAGGPGYLRNFVNPRCVTENTMRSGFTPELQL